MCVRHTMKHVLKYPLWPTDPAVLEQPSRRQLAAWLSGVALWGGVPSCGVRAADLSRLPLAVIYPSIEEPYRSVFLNIVRGIEARLKAPVLAWAIPPGGSTDQLQSRLRQDGVHTVIALGRSGLKTGGELAPAFNVVVGGVVSVPEADALDIVVQSLAPDPAVLFARLRAFMPRLRRVYVVHDPRQNAWLMRLAREASRQIGLELVVHEAQDLRSAVRVYGDLLPRINPRADAIWLPQDTATVDDTTVLPLLLKASWAQRFAVLSSNVAHVRRGALLALYPDNVDVGRELAQLALQSLGQQTPLKGIQPLRQLRTAVNTRTASHLGLDLAAAQQSIHLVLPEQ